jgi:hypothetical protein
MRPPAPTASDRPRLGVPIGRPTRPVRSAAFDAIRRGGWDVSSWRTSLLLFFVPLGLALASFLARGGDADPTLLAISDRATGAPVTDARVTIGERTFTADERGEVQIEAGDGSREVTVRSDRYAAVAGSLDPAPGERIAVALRPTTVEGRLTDADSGAPIADVAVHAITDAGVSAPVRTSPNGDYRLVDLSAGARLRIDAGDYGVVEEAIGDRLRVDVALRRSVVTGIVRDGAGNPIAGARVGSPDGTVAASTEADGTYRLTGTAGATELVVRAPGYADQRLPIPADRRLEVALQQEQVKAVYANSGTLGDPARLGRLIEIADTTEVNAIVIDVKQDTIYYETQVPFFRDIPGMITPLYDPAELLATLDEHGIYAIARMVVFKDPVVAEARPDLAVRDEVSGDSWRDMNGSAWVNAFQQELWRANADLAVEIAELGFDEVQYDYIRFPSDGDLTTADFGPDYSEEARRAAIRGAVALAADALRPTGARFAIDLFPIIALQGNDQGIGQTLQDLVPLADSVNLMIYPSHYEEGNIPVDGHPNDFPAETVTFTLERAEELVPGSRAKMRPWLQDFNYPAEGFSDYGPDEVRAQIDAAERFGASGWLLWNAAGEFQVGALAPEA